MKTKLKMRKISAVTVLGLVVILLGSHHASAQSSDDAYRMENFSVSGSVSLEVQTSGGSIQVVGSNQDEVSVEMYVRHRGNYIEAGEADLSDYEIDISQNGNTVKAIADRKSNGWNWNDGYSISFVVYTPQETRTRLKTSGGSLTAKNLTGTQELRTSGGSITTEGIQGEMVLKTSGGSISLNIRHRDATARGFQHHFPLNTSGGSISMTDIQGDVEANTSGGTIKGEMIVGNLDAKTSGGSIRLAGIEGRVEAKTSGGSINAEVLAPSELIDLKTSGGSITITVPRENGYDLDLDGNRVYGKLENFSGEMEKDEIRGTLNGGGTKIKAKTSGGSVRLEYL